MSEETNDKTTLTAENSYPQLCPICGAIMTQQNINGGVYWVCPDCGFETPVE